MTKHAQFAWISSIGLHSVLLIFAIFTWHAKPLSDETPSISVDIIAENASALGPKPQVENQSLPSPAPPIIAESEKTSPNPISEVTPMPKISAPEPIAQPVPNPSKPLPPNPIQKALSRITPQTPSPSPKAAPSTPNKPSVPAQKKSGETPPMFDLAAATRAASGVDSGGRVSPKLSSAKTNSRGNNAGGGARLQGDLTNALRNQVKDCWHEPADLSDPARLIVELHMELAPDGNFIRSRLLKPASKASADPTLKIAIDNAERAARQCAPYDLPQDRYEEWKSFTFRFDPRELRR